MTDHSTTASEHFDHEAGKFGMWIFLLTELFLFGNNSLAFGLTPEEHAQSLVNSTLAQQKALSLFYKLGIPYSKQHDFRVPGSDNVDSTFYDSSKRVIKHSFTKI